MISLVVPCRSEGKLLDQTILSAIQMAKNEIEVILIEDGCETPHLVPTETKVIRTRNGPVGVDQVRQRTKI